MDFSVLFKFIASNVSFFYYRQYIRDTLENGSPVCSTAGGDGIESSSGLTVQWVSAVNVSGLRVPYSMYDDIVTFHSID